MYFIEFATMTQHGDRGWNRINVPTEINPFIINPAHERLYHIIGVYAHYSLPTAVWVLLRPTRIRTVKEQWDGAYGFSSLSEGLVFSDTYLQITLSMFLIAHFTVVGENEAGVDLVLIQPFLLYYVNHVFLMLTSIF